MTFELGFNLKLIILISSYISMFYQRERKKLTGRILSANRILGNWQQSREQLSTRFVAYLRSIRSLERDGQSEIRGPTGKPAPRTNMSWIFDQ